MPASPGDPMRLVMTKWGGRPHWEMDGRFLGCDAAGDWVGFPAGTRMARPGRELLSPNDQVGLVPSADLPAGERAWLATFHGPGGDVRTYVDVTTPPLWDGARVLAVDLDLDVVETLEGAVLLDDEDEFAEHQVAFGYPPEVVAAARRTATAVLAAVSSSAPPFDGRATRWLGVLSRGA